MKLSDINEGEEVISIAFVLAKNFYRQHNF